MEEEQTETPRIDSASLLDSVQKAALCLRRAMVKKLKNDKILHVCCVVFLYWFYLFRCWPIVDTTGQLCSMCVRLCGTRITGSLQWCSKLLSLKLLLLSHLTSWAPSSLHFWCWLLISSWTCWVNYRLGLHTALHEYMLILISHIIIPKWTK